MICENCGSERKLYHPCPECGLPTFKDPEEGAVPA